MSDKHAGQSPITDDHSLLPVSLAPLCSCQALGEKVLGHVIAHGAKIPMPPLGTWFWLGSFSSLDLFILHVYSDTYFN